MRLWQVALAFTFLFPASLSATPDGQKVRVAGSVVSESSDPVSGAVVEVRFRNGSYPAVFRAWLAGSRSSPLVTGRSDRRGQFVLEVEGDQQLDVRVEKEGYLPATFALPFQSPQDSNRETAPSIQLPEVELEPIESWLDVRITNEAGQSAHGALVKARYEGLGNGTTTASRWGVGMVEVAASPEGAVAIPRPARGDLFLSAYLEGQPPVEIEVGEESGPIVLSPEPGEMREIRALDERSRPVADAMVRLSPGAWPVARTDGEGRARIPLPDGKAKLEILTRRVRASYEIPERGQRREADPISIRLGPTANDDSRNDLVAHGQIFDSEGRPMAGAEIYRWDEGDHLSRTPSGRPDVPGERMALSEKDGTFEIPLELEIASVLEVWADGHLPKRIYGVIASETWEQRSHRVYLEPAREVAGRVVSDAGEAIPRATVVLFDPLERGLWLGLYKRQELTGADGHFSFRRVPPRSSGLRLAVFAAGYVYLETAVPEADEDRETWEIELSPASSFSGVILDVEQKPIPDATVKVLRDDLPGAFIPPLATETRTDSEGRARIGGLREGRYEFAISHPEFSRRVIELQIERDDDPHEIVLERAAGYTVRGRVTNVEGKIGGLEVVLQPRAEGVRLSGKRLAGVTDEAGRFSILDVPAGKYAVDLLGTESALASEDEEVIVSGPTEIDLDLLPSIRMTGGVSGLSPSELQRLDVYVLAGRERSPGRVNPRSETYQVEGLSPGLVRVVAKVENHEGAGRIDLPAYLEPGVTEVTLDLEFDEMLVMRGLVIRGEDLLPDARIEIEGPVGGRSVRTDSKGEFEASGLEAGDYQLLIFEEGSAWRFEDLELIHVESIELDADRMLEIEVPPLSSIAGSVVDSSGVALPGVAVSLSREGEDRIHRKILTDPTGRFSFDRAPKGAWQLRFEKDGFSEAVQSIALTDEMAEIEVELLPGEDAKLRALLPDGNLPGQALITLLGPSGAPVFREKASPGPEGWLSLNDLPDGTWRLWIEADTGAFVALEDLFRVPSSPQEILLQERARVIVEAPTELGGSAAIVSLEDTLGRRLSRAEMQAGRVVFDPVPPGIWTLRLERAGGQSHASTVEAFRGATVRVTFRD